ncbi:MAG TPA: MOSC N-terminal beta barrel domain-containing protein [Streptosporangiaceae bacterium]|nr:MOSC N-terminal beta barrel domain-containing protein [Streptosporangiaceae bacterium]
MGTAVVEQLWRYPVKSIGGERIESTWADSLGVRGDRVWAVQRANGKLGSGKDSTRFARVPGLLSVTARYVDLAMPPVLTGTDGSEHAVADGSADKFLQHMTGMQDLQIRRDTGILHFDEVPFSLVGTATLDWLAAEVPGVPIEARRLRPNLVVQTSEPFAEEQWLHRPIKIGSGPDAAEAVFDRIFSRCVMVGMAQPGLTESSKVLKRIGKRTDHPVCLAIGGQITRDGTAAVGDKILFG